MSWKLRRHACESCDSFHITFLIIFDYKDVDYSSCNFGGWANKLILCANLCVCNRTSLRFCFPGSAWSLSGSVRQKNVWVPQKRNPRPLGQAAVLPSTLAAPLHPASLIPISRQPLKEPPSSLLIFYTSPSSKLSHPGKESLHHFLLTPRVKLQGPLTQGPLSAPQTTPLLLPHKPPAFPLCIVSPWPPLSGQKKRKLGGTGGREEMEGRRGECALSGLWEGGVHPHQGVEIPLQLPAFPPSLPLSLLSLISGIFSPSIMCLSNSSRTGWNYTKRVWCINALKQCIYLLFFKCFDAGSNNSAEAKWSQQKHWTCRNSAFFHQLQRI